MTQEQLYGVYIYIYIYCINFSKWSEGGSQLEPKNVAVKKK